MFKKLMVIAVVVGSVGMNGCGMMGGARPGQTAGGAVLGANPTTGAGAFSPTSLAGGNVLANLAQRPATPLPTARPPAANLVPGVNIPNAAGQQNLGNGLIWDQNIMGYRSSSTGERLEPWQAEILGSGGTLPLPAAPAPAPAPAPAEPTNTWT